MRRHLLFIVLALGLDLAAMGIILQPSAYHHAASGLTLLHSPSSNSRIHPSLQTTGLESSVTRFFGLSQLPFYNFHLAVKRARMGFSLGSSLLDNHLYQEFTTNLGFSYRWANISWGSSCHYLRTKTENFSSHSGWTLQQSLAWQEKYFSTVFTFYNILNSKLAQEEIPQILFWETALPISDKSILSIGLEKEVNYDFSLKLGSSYQIFSNFKILSSYQYQPDRLGIGMIFSLSQLEICYAIRTHQHLDLSHYITIYYEIFN